MDNIQKIRTVIAHDVELLKALKLTSIESLFSTNNTHEAKYFFYSFGESWIADYKTALEKVAVLNQDDAQTLKSYDSYDSNDRAIVIFIAKANSITIELDQFIQHYKPNQVLVVVADAACFNLNCDISALHVSTISFDIRINQRAQMRFKLENSKDLQDVLFCHVTSHIDEHATLEINQYQKYGKQLYFFDYYLEQSHASVKHLSSGALTTAMYQGIVTRQFHQAPYTKSDISIKTILDGDARSFYRGTIDINTNGAGSIAQQQHRALMVNDAAYTCGIPSLEVSAHEVQCTHGTAASSLDEQLLWYLQSKGLSYKQAKQFLVRSFLIKNNTTDDALESLIDLAQQRLT